MKIRAANATWYVYFPITQKDQFEEAKYWSPHCGIKKNKLFWRLFVRFISSI